MNSKEPLRQHKLHCSITTFKHEMQLKILAAILLLEKEKYMGKHF